jgi:hypothetical protein
MPTYKLVLSGSFLFAYYKKGVSELSYSLFIEKLSMVKDDNFPQGKFPSFQYESGN